MNPYSEFTCLYTSQKQKKVKTWQDGHLRFFTNNSKLVLYDTKFNVLDSSVINSTFYRSTIAIGDDMDMDKHLITVEGFTESCATNSTDQRPLVQSSNQPTLVQRNVTTTTQVKIFKSTASPSFATNSLNQPSITGPNNLQSDLKRKKWRPPIAATASPTVIQPDNSLDDSEWGSLDQFELQEAFLGSEGDIQGIMTNSSVAKSTDPVSKPSLPIAKANPMPVPKRRKVGLSRISAPASTTTSAKQSVSAALRPPSTQLEFPNAARCTNFAGKNQNQLLRRSMTLGSRFMSTNQYKDGMTFLIYEHLQLLVIEIAIAMWSITATKSIDGVAFDSKYRSRGIHMHSDSMLRRRGDTYSGFPMFSGIGNSNDGNTGAPPVANPPTSQQGVSLVLSNKEHHSKYSKDDLWVISSTSRFDATSTFFARSVFYGPSGNEVELQCLSPKDSSVARDILPQSTQVCGIRLFNAMSEFMMLDNLSEHLTRTPLLPVLINYVPPELIKASKTAIFKPPSRVPEKSGCVVLTEEDGIDVEMELIDTIEQYNLNQGQADVLRSFAQTVIRGPGWTQKSSDLPPIMTVHARPLLREERPCRFLVTSMTNVAVDRILMALLDLNYTNFVRVGSLKKVARRVLPYTAQSNTGRVAEEIKELQAILDDDSLSVKEHQYVRTAMKRFQKQENKGIVSNANVIGATCIASTFEVLNDTTFPIVILDEASQLLEPMSLIPICRAAAEKLIMVGDPLQLPPPINTPDDNTSKSKGLSRTLFDRSTEMGLKPIMLRTQYRCHHRIAEISNSLFYSNVLQTGIEDKDRAPLIEDLPTLAFIDSVGQEIQNARTKSYTNPAEIKLIVTFIQRLLNLNIPESSIGVISLYKSQADGIQSELCEQLKNSGLKGSVQISTVDAFQGSEKDIIIVSTVRTNSIGFIDNRERVNVALTRSKRHLFIVGHSQLLNSNSIWGAVIRDHCSGSPKGVVRADQFVQLLRTLQPLPKQSEPDPTLLTVSEDEEDEEIDYNNDRSGFGAGRRNYSDTEYDDEEEVEEAEDQYEDDDHYSSNDGATETPTRLYTLYKTDDEDSEDDYVGTKNGNTRSYSTAIHEKSRDTPSYLKSRINGQYSFAGQMTSEPPKSNIFAKFDSAEKSIRTNNNHNENFRSITVNSRGLEEIDQVKRNTYPPDQSLFQEYENDDIDQARLTESVPREQQGYINSLEGISQLDEEYQYDAIETKHSREENQVLVEGEKTLNAKVMQEKEEVIWEMDEDSFEYEEGPIDNKLNNAEFSNNAINPLKHEIEDTVGEKIVSLNHVDRGLRDSDGSSYPDRRQYDSFDSQDLEDLHELEVAKLSQLVASNEMTIANKSPIVVKIESSSEVSVYEPHNHLESRKSITAEEEEEEEEDVDNDDLACLEMEDFEMS